MFPHRSLHGSLSLDIAANGVQIIYTLDGSNPKNVQNQAVQSVSDQLELVWSIILPFDIFILV